MSGDPRSHLSDPPSLETAVPRATIRDAEPDDLPAVSVLLGETWHATYDAVYGEERVEELTRRWHAVGTLTRETALPDRRMLVAVVDGRVVGMASVRRVEDGAMLDRLYVLPDAQGGGVGTALLTRCLSAFPGCARMILEVEPSNAGAIRFYERHGFQVAGTTADCGGSGDGIPAITMIRQG